MEHGEGVPTSRRLDKAAPAKQGLPSGPALPYALWRRLHGMGLLSRLLVAEALVFAFVFAGGFLLIDITANSLRDNIKRERLLLGRAFAEDLDAFLDRNVVRLQQLAAGYRQAGTGAGAAGVQGVAGAFRSETASFTGGILIVGPGAEVLEADVEPALLAKIDLNRHWPNLWKPENRDLTVLTAAFRVEGRASPLVAIAVPVEGGRDGRYVVGLVDAEDSYPARLVARAVRLGGSGHAEIIDRGGVALFSTEAQHLLRTSDHPASYPRLFRQGEPVIAELPHEEDGAIQGEPHLMAFVPLKSVPWTLFIGTGVSEAFAPLRRLWDAGLGFLTFLTALALLATVFVARRLVQPVKALSATARSVAGGDRSVTIRIPWGGEIGDLARSLETMRLSLQASARELEERVRERTAELEQRNRDLVRLYDALQQKEGQLHTLLTKLLGAQEDERKRVSRELHDGIGQSLSALSMGLERLEEARPAQRDHFEEEAKRLSDLAREALSDLRRLAIALRPAALDDLGLVPAIRRYAELYLAERGLAWQVLDEGPRNRLDAALETVIYRVAQEAINNVARHSGATQASILLRSSGEVLTLLVEDNGRGFDPLSDAVRHGLGLQGMQERASLAGGKLTVDSGPGRGTTLRLEVPLAERDTRPRGA